MTAEVRSAFCTSAIITQVVPGAVAVWVVSIQVPSTRSALVSGLKADFNSFILNQVLRIISDSQRYQK